MDCEGGSMPFPVLPDALGARAAVVPERKRPRFQADEVRPTSAELGLVRPERRADGHVGRADDVQATRAFERRDLQALLVQFRREPGRETREERSQRGAEIE